VCVCIAHVCAFQVRGIMESLYSIRIISSQKPNVCLSVCVSGNLSYECVCICSLLTIHCNCDYAILQYIIMIHGELSIVVSFKTTQ